MAQVLERNYNRATIHLLYFKRFASESLLFIQLLKEIKANQTHSFYFVFIFTVIGITIYFCFQLFIFFNTYILKQTKIIKQKGKKYLPGYTGGASPPKLVDVVILSTFVDVVLYSGALPPPHLNSITLHKQHVETSTNKRLGGILAICISR